MDDSLLQNPPMPEQQYQMMDGQVYDQYNQEQL